MTDIIDFVANENNPVLIVNNETPYSNENTDVKIYPEIILNMNSFEFGYQNLQTSLSACAYFICSFMSKNLDYIARLPLIAVNSIKLYSDYEGLHELILHDSKLGKIVKIDKQLSLLGNDLFSISDGLTYSNNPYLPRLTGNAGEVEKLIAKANVETESGDDVRRLSELSKDEITDINNQLIIFLGTQGGFQREDLIFVKDSLQFPIETDNSIAHNAWDFAVAINDAINRNQIEIALGVLLGNRSEYLQKLNKLFIEERRAPTLSYDLMENKRNEIIELSCLRYFISDRKINWYNTSITAALALSNGLVTPDYPFAVASPGPGDLTTVAIRVSKNKITESITKITNKVFEKLGIDSSLTGSDLSCQFTVQKKDVEPIFLQINSYLQDLIK